MKADAVIDEELIRGYLDLEVEEKDFQAIAETICGHESWKDSPWLDDTSQGFSYYVNFKTIKAFDGQLVIGKCFWTRAGFEKSPNYYAGFIAVFDAPVRDARRDQALLRIWLWPDEFAKTFPKECGELIPKQIDPSIATSVRDFLSGLGYQI